MEYYLVSAIPRLNRMDDLETRLAADEFVQLRPFGPALCGSLRNARLSASGLAVWEEEDYCSPPLAEERAAVLDHYFDQLLTSQVRQGEGWERMGPLRPLFPALAGR
ncbi:MAG: hypothetical protein A3F68_07110 [Acidobacteria bacterium RIFCSPLOWO2_12_FULL_54_10]|nr:MAG: hypothetical protein A3F68_07110 [Acidobacteria bacterium RIFCSPLOWO2_12_FULL_54_10]